MIREIAFFSIATLGVAGCYAEPVYGDAAYAGGTATYDGTTDVDVPAPYVATTEPVYYGGRGAYYYNNAWRYREGGRWNTYRAEPGGLRQYRSNYAAGGSAYHGGGHSRSSGYSHSSGGSHGGGSHGGHR